MTNILSTRRLSGIFSLGSQSSASDGSGDIKEVYVEKDSKGYGFQVFGEYPAHIAQVREGCPAHRGGLAVHDTVIKIDSENVSNMAHDQIVALIRQRQKFNMTVRKGSAALQRQHYVPSSPIPISPQMDDIAKLGGYDVTCAMIAAECKRVLEFREQLEADDIADVEKVKLRSALASSQQIIQNLQRKVPESYLERIKQELNFNCVSDLLQGDTANQNGRSSDAGPLVPTKHGDDNSSNDATASSRRRPNLKRRASVNDRISRTHSIAQDVLYSFRTLRSQKVTTKSLFSQYGSLQNIVNKERQETLQENRRKLSRKNTISESNLQALSDSESTTTLKVDTDVGMVPGSPYLNYHRPVNSSVDSSHSKINFLKSASLTTHYIKEAFTHLQTEKSIEVIGTLTEALKEVFFLYFYGYIMSSPNKDRKEKDEFNRNCSALADMFLDASSETCLKLIMTVESSKLTQLAEEPELTRLQTVEPFCVKSLNNRVSDLISIYPNWVLEPTTKPDIERDLNSSVNQFESVPHNEVLTERVKFDLGVCVVTFLKLNKKRYKDKWGAASRNHRNTYYNLFTKKTRSNNSTAGSSHPPWLLNRSNTSAPHLQGLAHSPTSPNGAAAATSPNAAIQNSNSQHSRSSSEVSNTTLHSPRMNNHTGSSANNADETDSIDSVSSSSVNRNSSSNSISISSTGNDQLLLPVADVTLQNANAEGNQSLSSSTHNQVYQTAMSSAAMAANLKRTVSMKEETNATRNRKQSYTSKNTQRNASDPVASQVVAAAYNTTLPGRSMIDDSTSRSSSDMSSANSHTSLGATIPILNDGVKEKFNVCHYRDKEFTANDDFATTDKIVTKQVFKSMSKDQKKQQNILLEFLNSERKQTYNLKLLSEVFRPILLPSGNNSSVSFPEIAKLIDFHFTFYMRLLSCMSTDFIIQDVGPVFIEMFENTDYRTKFAEYYKWSSSKCFQVRSVRKLEEDNRSILEKRSLQDLMASEFQRATKYKLLVEALMKASSHISNEEKMNLDRALAVVSKLIALIDTDKGLQDFRLIVAKVDRSDIDRGGEQPSSHSHNTSPTIDMKAINLEENAPLMYGYHFALLKFLSKHTKEATVPQQLKQFKNYLVILFPEYLILVERDHSTDRLTWKTYLDQDKSLKTVILRRDILHVTSDSTRPLKDEQAELVKNQLLNFTCICTSLQLIVFVSTLEEKNKWMGLIKGSNTGPGGHSRNGNMSKSKKNKQVTGKNGDVLSTQGDEFTDESNTPTDAASFNFTEKVSYSTSGVSVASCTLKPSDSSTGSLSNDECFSELSSDERLARISDLRSQVISILKESFELARSVFDPDNILEPEKLTRAHQFVVDDQLFCLVDRECWLKQFDSPLMSLPGQLGTSDATEIHDVNFFLDDASENDAKKTLMLDVSEQDGGVSVAELPGAIKVFADKSSEPNEVHLQRPPLESSTKVEQRLHQKLNVLTSQIEEADYENEVDFDNICENSESKSCNERVVSSYHSHGNKYTTTAHSSTKFYSESVVLHHLGGESTVDSSAGDEADSEDHHRWEAEETENATSTSHVSTAYNSEPTSVSANNTVFSEVKVPSNAGTEEAETSAEIEDIENTKESRRASSGATEENGSCSTLKAENSTEFEQVHSSETETADESRTENVQESTTAEEVSDFDDIVISQRDS